MPAKPPNMQRKMPRICGRMCKDYGSQKSLFTYKLGSGDCQCQEQVDNIDECNTENGTLTLYKYSGKMIM